MASTTDTFIKSRVSKPTVGKWSSGFTAVKKYAETNKIPMLAVWSNGDQCGHCTHFEKVCMDSAFTKWQKSSGCVFWFGYYKDKSADDKFEGTGFKFARNNKLTNYPFVRLWWPAGKVDIYKSGDDWTGGIKEGKLANCVTKFLKALKAALKNFDPNAGKETTTTTQEPTPEPDTTQSEPSCDNGNCNLNEDESNCEDCECSDSGCTNCCCVDFTALREAVKTAFNNINASIDELEKNTCD